MPAGYEVEDPQTGQRAWWDGKKLTPLDASGMPVAAGGPVAPDPQAQFDDARQTMKLIDDAEGRVNFFSTGMLGRFGRGEKLGTGDRKGGWAGSPGYELEEAFMPLRARIKLQNAAAAKAQGVNLAPMSNTDAASLEATLGSLDVGRSEQSIKTTLGDVRAITARRQRGLTRDNPYDQARDAGPSIPYGALFRGVDGKLYTNTRGAPAVGARKPPAPAPRGGQSQGGRSNLPPGVTAAEWAAMTPQERALFK